MYPEEFLSSVEPFFTNEQFLEIEHAVEFAASYHDGQFRKSGEPFVTHPLAVAHTLVKWGLDADTVIAGILHDTVEDTEADFDDIENLFGYSVAFLVDSVSKNDTKYLPGFSSAIDKLCRGGAKDSRAFLIKLADRLHNLSTLSAMPDHKRIRIAKESIEIYAQIAHLLSFGKARRKIEKLSFHYVEPVVYKKYQRYLKSQIRKQARELGKNLRQIETILQNNTLPAIVTSYAYDPYRLYRQIQKSSTKQLNNRDSIVQIYIITPHENDCEPINSLIEKHFTVNDNAHRNYIKNPTLNGYRAIRGQIKLKNRDVEYSIMSEDMYNFSEYGIIANPDHKLNPITLDAIIKYPKI